MYHYFMTVFFYHDGFCEEPIAINLKKRNIPEYSLEAIRDCIDSINKAADKMLDTYKEAVKNEKYTINYMVIKITKEDYDNIGMRMDSDDFVPYVVDNFYSYFGVVSLTLSIIPSNFKVEAVSDLMLSPVVFERTITTKSIDFSFYKDYNDTSAYSRENMVGLVGHMVSLAYMNINNPVIQYGLDNGKYNMYFRFQFRFKDANGFTFSGTDCREDFGDMMEGIKNNRDSIPKDLLVNHNPINTMNVIIMPTEESTHVAKEIENENS